MLSTSTSNENSPASASDFAGLERQETSGSDPERPIPVACDQNLEGATSPAQGQITQRLIKALDLWKTSLDRRALRLALLELLTSLND
jgi:hypothetical protein